MDVAESIVREVRRKAEVLARLFAVSGKLVVHVCLSDRERPVRLEAQVQL